MKEIFSFLIKNEEFPQKDEGKIKKETEKNEEITLDMHNLTQDEAYEKMHKIVSRCYYKKITIITGKSGILNQKMHLWFEFLEINAYKILKKNEGFFILIKK